ncbi:hypothetical protein [Spirosoma radiotolerans]|uniref:Uncharacterized protein n=1 Tax=Spirosoma radiotolerans TaxID=1379870 RepID=A0A0E3ZTW0_9BACT|nr:hypothetical protein [Spirosoma radiotolerans]AKD54803.1 hypothetical protein SD10_07675 [Spirosoma radiotolerans]
MEPTPIVEQTTGDYSHINGWGIDADPNNEPTYPMKHYTGDDHERLNWERPPLQPATVEVLHSNERPTLTAVFGTSSPPSGLSGALRRYAFTFSESEYGHWLPLLLADRINVVEGIVDDLKQGHIPNIFAEKGWKADWKYNRKGLVQNVLVGVAVTTAVIALLSRKKKPTVGYTHKRQRG